MGDGTELGHFARDRFYMLGAESRYTERLHHVLCLVTWLEVSLAEHSGTCYTFS